MVASHDLQSGNGKGLSWFGRFIDLSLTYLHKHLPTNLQPRDPHGASNTGKFTDSSEANALDLCLTTQVITSVDKLEHNSIVKPTDNHKPNKTVKKKYNKKVLKY